MTASSADTAATLARDVEWTPVGDTDEQGNGIFIALQYGELGTHTPTYLLMKYSAGVVAPPHLHSGDYYAVVVAGAFRHYLHDEDEFEVLGVGSTWFQRGGVVHGDRCVGPEDGITALFCPNGFDVEIVESSEGT